VSDFSRIFLEILGAKDKGVGETRLSSPFHLLLIPLSTDEINANEISSTSLPPACLISLIRVCFSFG